MTSPHVRKLKLVTFDLGGENFEVQLKTWKLNNATDDPEIAYTFGPNGAYAEESDPAWTLECVFLADWRLNGVSDYLMVHGGETVTYQIDHHPDIPLEHVRFSGELTLKKPSIGGEARATELTEITFALLGEPTYAHL